MGAVKAHSWKELVEQAEKAEKSVKKFETPKSRWEINDKSYDIAEPSDTSALEVLLAQRPITLVLMMINSCSYSTNDLVFN